MPAYLSHTDYRPLKVLVDIAQRNYELPIEIHSAKPYYQVDHKNYGFWNGDNHESRRFEFETIYQDQNYISVSLASYRPDGNFRFFDVREQGPYCEHSVWRIGIKGQNNGAVQIFGNAGEFETMAGRHPKEEISQYRNITMRFSNDVDSSWIAYHNSGKIEIDQNVMFLKYPTEVYFAAIPIGYNNYKLYDTNMENYHLDNHHKVVYFNTDGAYNAVIQVVGNEREYGDYIS